MPVFARQRIKPLEDTRQRKVRDPRPGIGNRQRDPISLRPRAQGNGSPSGVKSMALSSKLPSACSSKAGSAATVNVDGIISSAIFFVASWMARASLTCANSASTATGECNFLTVLQPRLAQQRFNQHLHPRILAENVVGETLHDVRRRAFAQDFRRAADRRQRTF